MTLISLNSINNHTEKWLDGSKEQPYVMRKRELYKCVKVADVKYSGILDGMRKKPASHTAPEISELKAYEDSDGSYIEKEANKKWEGRSEVGNGGIHAGLLYFLEGSVGYIPNCPLMYTIPRGV